METILYHYQHLPFYLDPVIFSWGSFRLDWYSLGYLIGFLVVLFLLKIRVKKGEFDEAGHLFENGSRKLQNDLIFDLLLYVFVGLLVGGRLGYVFFYNLPFYLENPSAIFSPFDASSGELVEIYGMSYHGGLLGALIMAYIFARVRKSNFWSLANFVAPAVPAGYFFGRLGNFFNGELYGRATQKIWGMFFPADPTGFIRHPSQLYEAFLEGILLFAILWLIRKRIWARNNLLAFYLVGYAIFRITAEFFREPDEQIGYIFNYFSLGQFLSFLMFLGGVSLWFCSQKSKKMV